MADVCRLLAHAWSLRFLWPCVTDSNLECLRVSMGRDLHALDIAITRHGTSGFTHLHLLRIGD